MFSTAYIGLFDWSLLHMSLNQLELALKNTTFRSRTAVSMYQFDPFFNSIWEIIKTSHTQIFLFFSMMKRVRKGSDLPKKKWGSPSVQQKYSHTKLTERSSALCFVVFSNRCARLKMTMWENRIPINASVRLRGKEKIRNDWFAGRLSITQICHCS